MKMLLSMRAIGANMRDAPAAPHIAWRASRIALHALRITRAASRIARPELSRNAAGVASALLLAMSSALYAQTSTLPADPPDAAPQATNDIGIARALDAVLERALSLRGTRYRAGGTSPETGFDCSGFVGFLYRDIVGFQLPRSAPEIWRFGKTVEHSDLRPGDLVFYNTLRRPYSHVGIYLGGNQFVHAPTTGGVVRVVNMDERYWAKRWNGAKRVAH